jgi:hypothetical protein
LVNIYTAHDGFWSVTAVVTAVVTGICTVITLVLYLVYDTWLLNKIKREHNQKLARSHDGVEKVS